MKRNNPAFTLLELLIAVTIFSIIALSLYSTFYTGMKALRSSQGAMRIHQSLRLVTEELSLDLRNSLLAPLHEELKTAVIEAAAEEKEEEPLYYFLGDSKRFSFVTMKDCQICNITYYADKGKFMRTIKYQGRGFAAPAQGGETLLEDIRNMEVLYSYEAETEDGEPVWLDIWEEEELVPLGVKITLELKGLGSLEKLTKTVYIPVGALGTQGEEEI